MLTPFAAALAEEAGIQPHSRAMKGLWFNIAYICVFRVLTGSNGSFLFLGFAPGEQTAAFTWGCWFIMSAVWLAGLPGTADYMSSCRLPDWITQVPTPVVSNLISNFFAFAIILAAAVWIVRLFAGSLSTLAMIPTVFGLAAAIGGINPLLVVWLSFVSGIPLTRRNLFWSIVSILLPFLTNLISFRPEVPKAGLAIEMIVSDLTLMLTEIIGCGVSRALVCVPGILTGLLQPDTVTGGSIFFQFTALCMIGCSVEATPLDWRFSYLTLELFGRSPKRSC